MAIHDEDMSVTRYLREIGNTKPLSAEEEKELAKRIQQGDMEARDKLVQANLLFVVSIAKQYQNNGLPFSDLINEGNIGLITAAERFNANKGFKFVSYAIWWIRQSILQALYEQTRVIRKPINQVGELIRIHKTVNNLWQKLGTEPTSEQIAAELGVETEKIQAALADNQRVLSLDEVFGHGDEERNLYDIVEDTSIPAPDANLITQSAKDHMEIMIDTMMSPLREQEDEVIKWYFGLKGRARLTLKQIAEHMGLTKGRVQQIKELALLKLRNLRIPESEYE